MYVLNHGFEVRRRVVGAGDVDVVGGAIGGGSVEGGDGDESSRVMSEWLQTVQRDIYLS